MRPSCTRVLRYGLPYQLGTVHYGLPYQLGTGHYGLPYQLGTGHYDDPTILSQTTATALLIIRDSFFFLQLQRRSARHAAQDTQGQRLDK